MHKTLEKGSPVGGASLLEDVSLPAAVLHEQPLLNNIRWMQQFAEAHGAALAPHGKTSMTPALFKHQLVAGAWGITLATATQCAVAFEHGASRLLMANQLVGGPNMAVVADLIERGADFYCVVDSVANVHALSQFYAQRGLLLQVLIELGVPGGRCGVRSDVELHALARAVADAPALSLRGIEGYEGLIHGEQAAAGVRAYGQRLVESLRSLHDAGLLGDGMPLVTASGSRWFDLIAEAFVDAGLEGRCVPLLRPGCYVAHDHRLYRQAMDEVKQRQPGLVGELQPALEVFAHVQSLPEPGLAVVAMGKRDISCDPDLPIVLRHYRSGEPQREAVDCSVRGVMDQHCLLDIGPDADLAVGDILAFGASHPCLTFDKWRQVLLVDEDLQVLEAMPTCF